MKRLKRSFWAKAAVAVASIAIAIGVIGGISFASNNQPFLGDCIEYGIVCNYLNQTADMETNFVAGKYQGNGHWNGNTISESKANASGEIRIGEVVGESKFRGTPYVVVKESVKDEVKAMLASVSNYAESVVKKADYTTPKVTATPTPKVTATPTPKVTATPTPKVTATPTPKVTATPTPKVTATPTPKVTATPTPKVTATPTPGVTATPEVTPTATPKVTPTATPGDDATPTPEVTPTATPGDDATPTPEVTATATPNLFDFDEDTPRASKELTDPDTPKASATSKKTTTLLDEDVPLSDSAPETGDTTNLLFPMIVMGLSVLAIFGVIVFRKKMN